MKTNENNNSESSNTRTGDGRVQRLVRLLIGDVYRFRHPRAVNEIKVRARSEVAAWKKLENSIQAQMYGRLALTYNPRAVKKVLDECIIYLPNAKRNRRSE